jgi:hypothetical protein
MTWPHNFLKISFSQKAATAHKKGSDRLIWNSIFPTLSVLKGAVFKGYFGVAGLDDCPPPIIPKGLL